MENDINMPEDRSYTKCDEVDGSVISSLKRRKGVKVTGKYLPPLEWQRGNISHSIGSLNNTYFEDKYNDREHYFQASDVSTKLLLKDERQSSTRKDTRGDDLCKTEQEKQRMESVMAIQTSGPKNAEDVAEEKMNSKQGAKNIHEKPNKYLLPSGSAIPKETLEELKSILKDSPLITCKNKWSQKPTTSTTLIHPPNQAEKPSENLGLTFETFKPYWGKETHKLQCAKTPESSESDDLLTGQTLPDHAESQKEEQLMQPILPFVGNQKLIPDKSNNASGIKFDPPSSDVYSQRKNEMSDEMQNDKINSPLSFTSLTEKEAWSHLKKIKIDKSPESICSSSKRVYATSSGSQNPLQIVSCVEHIKQQIAREDIRFVRFEAADLHGVSRWKTIPARFFQDKAVNGIYMPRSYLELTLSPKNNEVDHINSKHFSCDIILKPDLQTFRVLPWTEKTARVICDSFTFLGDPLLTSPRYLAKRLLNQLEDTGFFLHASFTYEFCIFGITEMINSKTGSFPAATLLTDHDQSFIQELFDGMYYIGGNIESFSSSIGSGQMEITFQPDYGLQAADNAFTFRTAIKEVAKKHGCLASFYTDMVGFYNSGVLSHSLWDINGKNLFYSGTHMQELTDIGKNWLSGLLLHSAALSGLVAPGVACRKHLSNDVKESQENISATWGFNNNNATYNVKSSYNNETYIVNKLCSAMANPYLVLAATVAAGLDGIKKGLNFFDSISSNTDPPGLKLSPIPLKLEDALSALQEDKFIRASLGEPFIRYFIAMKQYELETEEVDSERNKFLEYFI